MIPRRITLPPPFLLHPKHIYYARGLCSPSSSPNDSLSYSSSTPSISPAFVENPHSKSKKVIRANKANVSSSLVGVMEELKEKLYIVKMDDWYQVPFVFLNEMSFSKYPFISLVLLSYWLGRHLFTQYRNMLDLLQHAFPTHTWDKSLFIQRGFRQKHMERCIRY